MYTYFGYRFSKVQHQVMLLSCILQSTATIIDAHCESLDRAFVKSHNLGKLSLLGVGTSDQVALGLWSAAAFIVSYELALILFLFVIQFLNGFAVWQTQIIIAL